MQLAPWWLQESEADDRPGLPRTLLYGLALLVASALAATALLTWPAVAQGPLEVELDCVIEPSATVAVNSGVLSGVFSAVLVERGDRVTEGQVLAIVDSRLELVSLQMALAQMEARSALAASLAARDYAESHRKRQAALYAAGIVSLEKHEEAETQARIAFATWKERSDEVRLRELEAERASVVLDQREIVSPIDGIVIERLVSVGEFAGEAKIVRVARLDPLNVEIVVPAAHFGAIRTGMVWEVFPEAPISGRYQAEVVIVDSVLDAASDTFGVRLELPNRNYRLPGGLRARARIVSQ